MEREQYPLKNVLSQTLTEVLELSFLEQGWGRGGVGGLRMTSAVLEISSVVTKLTHIHTLLLMHAHPHPYAPSAEKQSDCPEARPETVPSPHTSSQPPEASGEHPPALGSDRSELESRLGHLLSVTFGKNLTFLSSGFLSLQWGNPPALEALLMVTTE